MIRSKKNWSPETEGFVRPEDTSGGHILDQGNVRVFFDDENEEEREVLKTPITPPEQSTSKAAKTGKRRNLKRTSKSVKTKIALPGKLLAQWKASGLTYRECVLLQCRGELPKKTASAVGIKALVLLSKGPGLWLRIPREARSEKMFAFLRKNHPDWLSYVFYDLGDFATRVMPQEWVELCLSEPRALCFVPSQYIHEVLHQFEEKLNKSRSNDNQCIE